MWAFAKAKPFLSALLGAAAGVLLMVALLHAWTLYWSLRGVIEFINKYGAKIAALP